MKKLILIPLMFLGSVSLAGFRTDVITSTQAKINGDASALSTGQLETKTSANGVVWWMEHTGAASTGNYLDWDFVLKGGAGAGELFGNMRITSIGVGLGSSNGQIDYYVKYLGSSTNILSLRGSDMFAIFGGTVSTPVVQAATTTFNGVTYTWPSANAVGQATNNGSGVITWAAASGGASTRPSSFTYVFNAEQAGLGKYGLTSPTISNSTGEAMGSLLFDETSTMTVVWSTVLAGYQGGQLAVDFLYTSSATSGTVNFGAYIQCDSMTTAALDTASFSTINSTSTTTNATTGRLTKGTAVLSNGDSCANGNTAIIKVERSAGALDSMVGYAKLRKMVFYEQ